MKYIIIILIVVALIWLARARRRPPVRGDKTSAPPAIEDMVTCAVCAVHLPKSDALPGRGGYFCGEAHRKAHESKDAPR